MQLIKLSRELNPDDIIILSERDPLVQIIISIKDLDKSEFIGGERIVSKKKKVIIIIAIILFVLISMIVGLYIRDRALRRADYYDGKLSFDGKSYIEIDYREIEPYKETWKVVCKTTDGVWTVYEIEQYPDHEYLVVRTSWEARVLKQVN